MKYMTPVLKNLPVVQIIEVANTFLNHSEKMKQIRNEYRLAKSEMKRQYALQRQALDNDLSKFKEMAKLQSQHFREGHVERIKLLQTVQDLSKAIAHSPDIQLTQELKGIMELVLQHYQKNRENNIDFLEYTPKQMIGVK